MRRLFVLLLALFALAPAASSAPPKDWRATVVQTKAGSFVIGNPAAKVKLVEYLSYTCPHCAHFVAASKATLHDDWVRRGVVQVEIRHAVRDPMDMGAAILARCTGARRFWPTTEAIFEAQGDWADNGYGWQQRNAMRLSTMDGNDRPRVLADMSGLTDLARGRGLTDAAINACFANQGERLRLAAQTSAAFAKIQGTPGFEINGKLVSGSDWATLEPKLRAAGAR